jgi:hypothetical protein
MDQPGPTLDGKVHRFLHPDDQTLAPPRYSSEESAMHQARGILEKRCYNVQTQDAPPIRRVIISGPQATVERPGETLPLAFARAVAALSDEVFH